MNQDNPTNLDNEAALFTMGNLVMTQGVDEWSGHSALKAILIASVLARHATGDWGDIHPDDEGSNEHAIEHGLRIMSVYKLEDVTLWVITEADRSSTTVLLPDEY